MAADRRRRLEHVSVDAVVTWRSRVVGRCGTGSPIPDSRICDSLSCMAEEAVEGRSKVLFGSRHMLAVAAAIAELGPDIRARQIEESEGLAPSTVHRSLATLSSAALLVRLPRERGEREQSYARVAHPFWDAARTLRADVVQEASR